MKIPKKIRIAGMDYEVVVKNGLIGENVGQINYNTCVITVSDNDNIEDMSDQQIEKVLLHEIIHGVLKEYAPKNNNEALVDQLSSGFYDVIKNNPGIFADSPKIK